MNEKIISANWTLNEGEMKDFIQYSRSMPNGKNLLLLASIVLGVFVFSMAYVALTKISNSSNALLISIIIGVISGTLLNSLARHKIPINSISNETNRAFMSTEVSMEASSKHLQINLGTDIHFHSWENVIKIDKTDRLILILKSPNEVISIPKRTFGEKTQSEQILRQLKQFHQDSINQQSSV